MAADRRQLFPTLASAAVLAALGVSGLMHAEGRSAIDGGWQGGEPEFSRLEEREATLHQRRGAEELLGAFTRAQLTRHYWGQFASSLTDLGLIADPSLQARVDTGADVTRLWLTPRRGDEAYLSQVSSVGGKLLRVHCRGPAVDANQSDGVVADRTRCPAGWTVLSQ